MNDPIFLIQCHKIVLLNVFSSFFPHSETTPYKEYKKAKIQNDLVK